MKNNLSVIGVLYYVELSNINLFSDSKKEIDFLIVASGSIIISRKELPNSMSGSSHSKISP